MLWGKGRNREGGLQNIMDIDDIEMWEIDDSDPDNIIEGHIENYQHTLFITTSGLDISPTLAEMNIIKSDRPFRINELSGEWFAEKILAIDDPGRFANPVIVRDGNCGRLIPVLQTQQGNEPKGEIAAEIIRWLMPVSIPDSNLRVNLKKLLGLDEEAGVPIDEISILSELNVSGISVSNYLDRIRIRNWLNIP